MVGAGEERRAAQHVRKHAACRPHVHTPIRTRVRGRGRVRVRDRVACRPDVHTPVRVRVRGRVRGRGSSPADQTSTLRP